MFEEEDGGRDEHMIRKRQDEAIIKQ